jgi:cell fate regulator YaaT (PSP1 superfamily)
MSASPELLARPGAALQYIVSFGKAGGVGVFTADQPLSLRRGERVAIRSPRGAEAGTVLCPATVRQARLLGATASGPLLRPLNIDDKARLAEQRPLAQRLYDAARRLAEQERLSLEVLDVEVLLDGDQAIVQFVGEDIPLDAFAQLLEQQFNLQIRLENVAQRSALAEEEHGGCDKPDCGRDAGGCSTCSTGGGCSSCGSKKVDMRDYFVHLREKMEKGQRRPLL